jgi:hypothetical protein
VAKSRDLMSTDTRGRVALLISKDRGEERELIKDPGRSGGAPETSAPDFTRSGQAAEGASNS